MRFVLRMALREIRASWQRLIFFFVCIAIGVASIVAIRSVIQSVRVTLSYEARALVAADLRVMAEVPISDDVRRVLASEQRSGRIVAQAEAIEVATMARVTTAGGPARMVELKAVTSGFPFYGELLLQEGRYTHEILRNRGALVRPDFLAQLGLRVGDSILIGQHPFQIRGVIASEPGRSLGVFTLGPRVLIDHADLDSTGLLSTVGSRADYEILLKVPDAVLDGLSFDLQTALANDFVRVRSYRRNQDRMGQNLTRAENYLSLVGLVVLVLGGIGVSSVVRVFVQQKLRSMAILKCLGASSRQVLAVYITQVLLLGVAGSAVGVAIAAGVIAIVPRLVVAVAELLRVDFGLTAGAVLQGFGVGVLVSLLFSVVPLLDVRHVKPSLLLRQALPVGSGVDWVKWITTGSVALALVGVASWQAGSIRIGLLISAGFVATALVLHVAGALLIRAVQPLRHARSFALRQAVLHVARPGNHTRVVLLAVGLGVFFILGVRSLQTNLLRDFSVQLGESTADLFLMDVQPDQRNALVDQLQQAGLSQDGIKLIPVLRAHVVGVTGRDVQLESYEEVRRRGNLSRDYTVTYRSRLEANERIVAGTWWGEEPAAEGQAEVSVEASLRERYGIQLGDQMRFDVLGRIVPARVTSFREVDFRDFRAGGFMIVFRPGTFDQAPHTFFASLRGPRDAAERGRLQSRIVSRFGNVSVIDLREVLDTIQGVVTNVTLGVTLVGGLVLLSGALILVGAVSMTKFRRVYEAAILKTLGASSRVIATMLLLEYGVLGAIAGTVGAAGAILLSWAIARYALELTWEPSPGLTAIGIATTAICVALIGVLASLDVLRHKPLGTLRAE
ncbi:MAG: ABC transporter permease [Vicinamibacterales bacterium]